MVKPKISVIVPTWAEQNISKSLESLHEQSALRDMEVIIADYDPDRANITRRCVWDFIDGHPKMDLKIINVPRKGIAFARHSGILTALGDVILNFDADARFNTSAAVMTMCQPIIDGKAVITCCDNIFDLTDLAPEELIGMQIPELTLQVLNSTQKTTAICCLEPGSAFSKQAYHYVGGFNDIPFHELFHLSTRMNYHYTPGMKRWIAEVSVFVSSRRAKRFNQFGIGVLSYDVGFRDHSGSSIVSN